MLSNAIFSYFHYLSILFLFATLIAEYIIIKPGINKTNIPILAKTDIFYGIASVLILVTGTLKVVYFAKGMNYYLDNSLFWSKISVFGIVGLLSLLPTIQFIRWNTNIKKGIDFEIPLSTSIFLKRVIVTEIILVLSIPLFAALMSRGFGN